MAERVVDDDEKPAHIEPEGAAQDRSPQEPGQHMGHGDQLSSSDPEKQHELGAVRTITQTTTYSALALESPASNSTGRKPWYKNLNPLKRGKATPVPADRTVSKEYGASLLSRLTFQWMAPLMKVYIIYHVFGSFPFGTGYWGRLTGGLGRLPTTAGTQRYLAGESRSRG